MDEELLFEQEELVPGSIRSLELEYQRMQAAQIRLQHLDHEASVRSIGTLYTAVSCLSVVACGVGVFDALTGADLLPVPEFLVLLVGGAVLGIVGLALRRLQSWTLFRAALFSLLRLPAFPLGTFICIRICYLLVSFSGGYVLSDEYKSVILQTPDIKYKTSVVVWIFVMLLFLAGAFAMVMIVSGF